ncbi:MAG: L-rhamnose mutarotase [Actinomycetota bacterium]|nr:L-rhamnose mutarotase [Actinomycetota bacterium]
MERMCFTFEIFEGKEAEYKKRHDEIWPELVMAIKEAGFRNYSLFRRGTNIVGYFEVEPNAATAFAKLGKHESNARWAKWFEDVIVNLTDNKGNLMEMVEVWHLD